MLHKASLPRPRVSVPCDARAPCPPSSRPRGMVLRRCDLAPGWLADLAAVRVGRCCMHCMARVAVQEEPPAAAEVSATTTTLAPVMTPPARTPGPLDSLDDIHSHRQFLLAPEQLGVISELRKAIANCAVAFAAVAGTNILLSVVQAAGLGPEEMSPANVFMGITVGDVAYWADSAMLVTLLLFALGPLDNVLNCKSDQMVRVFQGLQRLSLIFQQLSIGSFAVSTVTALEAAVEYPPLVVFASEVFFALALMRGAAMGYVLREHTSSSAEVTRTLNVLRGCELHKAEMPLLERAAVWLAFGYLLEFEEKEPHQKSGNGLYDYEFSRQEERVLKSLSESVNVAGMGIALQAISVFLLATAEFGTGDWSGVVSNGINCANKVVMATLVFQASSSFDKALHSEGSDLDHLMTGLGEHGLEELFNKLSVLAWAVSLAAFLSVGMPYLEESALMTSVSELGSHRVAEAVVEGIETMIKVLRGI